MARLGRTQPFHSRFSKLVPPHVSANFRTLTAVIAAIGLLNKNVAVPKTATTTISAVIANVKAKLAVLAGAVSTIVGSIKKFPHKTLFTVPVMFGLLTPIGKVLRLTFKTVFTPGGPLTLAGTMHGVGNIIKLAKLPKAGSLANMIGIPIVFRTIRKTLAAAVTLIGSVLKLGMLPKSGKVNIIIGKIINTALLVKVGTTVVSGLAVVLRVARLVISALVITLGLMLRQGQLVKKSLMLPVGTGVNLRLFVRLVAGALTVRAAIIRTGLGVKTGLVTTASVMTRAMGHFLNSVVVPIGQPQKLNQKPMAGTAITAGTVKRLGQRINRGVMAFVGVLSLSGRNFFLVVTGSLAFSSRLILAARHVILQRVIPVGGLKNRVTHILSNGITAFGTLLNRAQYHQIKQGFLTAASSTTKIRVSLKMLFASLIPHMTRTKVVGHVNSGVQATRSSILKLGQHLAIRVMVGFVSVISFTGKITQQIAFSGRLLFIKGAPTKSARRVYSHQIPSMIGRITRIGQLVKTSVNRLSANITKLQSTVFINSFVFLFGQVLNKAQEVSQGQMTIMVGQLNQLAQLVKNGVVTPVGDYLRLRMVIHTRQMRTLIGTVNKQAQPVYSAVVSAYADLITFAHAISNVSIILTAEVFLAGARFKTYLQSLIATVRLHDPGVIHVFSHNPLKIIQLVASSRPVMFFKASLREKKK